MEYKSPAFSDFRRLMDIWDESTKKSHLEKVLNGKGLIFFFKKGDDFFGAPEDGRLSFARLMNPDDEDNGCGSDNDANVTMHRLKSLLGGGEDEEGMQVFHKKDLNDINILPIEDILSALMKGKI